MTPLDEAYEHISDPTNFVKNFACMQQFRLWCEQVTINDLKYTLRAFEKHEMYEYCPTIQAVMDEKSDVLLRGFGLDI